MRRGSTKQLTDSILGQHIALSVAAGLARTQLVADPLKVYDAQHLSEIIDIVARALAKVAPLYVRESPDAEPRALTPEEQEAATIRRGATQLVLKSGLTFSSVTMKRGDLRQAVAVLRAVGIPELGGRRPPEVAEPGAPADPVRQLLAEVADIERLLAGPLIAAQLDTANRAALSIARRAPQGRVSNLAMQLMSCLHEARGGDQLPDKCWLLVARLRTALEETHAA